MTIRRIIADMAIGLALIMSGCSSPLKPPVMNPDFSKPPVEAYHIATGDTLSIDVRGDADLSREVLVGRDGRISLPLVGHVHAAGLTVEELEKELIQIKIGMKRI